MQIYVNVCGAIRCCGHMFRLHSAFVGLRQVYCLNVFDRFQWSFEFSASLFIGPLVRSRGARFIESHDFCTDVNQEAKNERTLVIGCDAKLTSLDWKFLKSSKNFFTRRIIGGLAVVVKNLVDHFRFRIRCEAKHLRPFTSVLHSLPTRFQCVFIQSSLSFFLVLRKREMEPLTTPRTTIVPVSLVRKPCVNFLF